MRLCQRHRTAWVKPQRICDLTAHSVEYESNKKQQHWSHNMFFSLWSHLQFHSRNVLMTFSCFYRFSLHFYLQKMHMHILLSPMFMLAPIFASHLWMFDMQMSINQQNIYYELTSINKSNRTFNSIVNMLRFHNENSCLGQNSFAFETNWNQEMHFSWFCWHFSSVKKN